MNQDSDAWRWAISLELWGVQGGGERVWGLGFRVWVGGGGRVGLLLLLIVIKL